MRQHVESLRCGDRHESKRSGSGLAFSDGATMAWGKGGCLRDTRGNKQLPRDASNRHDFQDAVRCVCQTALAAA